MTSPTSSSGTSAAGSQSSAPVAASPSAARWSLEKRLPFAFFLFLTAALAAFGIATYRETRASAIDRARDRLSGVSEVLAGLSSQGTVARFARVSMLANNAAVRQALAAGTVDLLGGILTSSDTTVLGYQIVGRDMRVRYSNVRSIAADDSSELPAAVGATLTSGEAQTGALFVARGRLHFWTVAPIRDGFTTLGALAELRQLAIAPAARGVLQRLVGDDLELFVTTGDPKVWGSLGGQARPALVAPPANADLAPNASTFDDAQRGAQADSSTDAEPPVELVVGTDGARYYYTARGTDRSPSQLVLIQSEASVLRRPHEFIRTLITIGLMLLAVGTVLAWIIGRRLVHPLTAFTDATAAIAEGDFSQRVPVRGGDEIAQLARTFNGMAQRIGDARGVLQQQNAALVNANEAKTRFLAMMSHELRTPLNAIGGYADMLAMGLRGAVTPEQTEDLSRIRRNKDQLLHIIADILHFSRMDAGHVGVRLEAVPVGALFASLTDTIGFQYAQKGVRLAFDGTDAVVLADPQRLRQILVNLLTNAFNFTPPGGAVRVWTEPHGTAVHILVRDTGMGIPADRIESIFEPFVQVDTSLTRRVGGTGLGLPISRELAAAMGGTLTAASVEGQGSTFTVALPSAERTAVGTAPAD